jgi:hypothetical protein
MMIGLMLPVLLIIAALGVIACVTLQADMLMAGRVSHCASGLDAAVVWHSGWLAGHPRRR